MDSIAKNAVVSKGLIFHYFESKMKLYLFLYDYCSELLSNEIFQKFKYTDTDFFNRLEQLQHLKLGLLQQSPYLTSFLQAAHFEEDREIIQAILVKNEKITVDGFQRIFADINYDKFKSNIDPAMVIQLITWTTEGFTKEIIQKGEFQTDTIVSEFNKYLELFKNNFYKEEYLK